MAIWYVRPDTTHSGTRNGLTYATAWGGWSEIVWGASGVFKGDTLFVCGPHSYASSLTVGVHGGISGQRVTISGLYAPDPGTISSATAGFNLENDQPFTIITGLTLPQFFLTASATNCDYTNNIFLIKTNQNGISFFNANGQNHSDILISGNTFTSLAGVTTKGALRWLGQTAISTSLTRLTISNNTFTALLSSRSIIELRSQTDAAVAAHIQDIVLSGNTFVNSSGLAVEFNSPGNPIGTGSSSGVRCTNNTFTNLQDAVGAPGIGGCLSIQGFAHTTTAGFGENLISGNVGVNVQGGGGLIDVFYGSYIIQDNRADTLYTSTIDGNGILFDLGTTNSVARRNYLKNVIGKFGVTNSGCGIMILNNAVNCVAYGNIIDGCRIGVFYGPPGTLTSSQIFNNTFLNVSISAVNCDSTATQLNNHILKNNVFSGTGFSVNDQTAVTWVGEDYNRYYGFTSGSVAHTLGTNDTVDTTQSNVSTLLIDPATYAVGNGSPLFRAGIFVAYASDYLGLSFTYPSAQGHSENHTFLPRAVRV
jgi:hypothetical protein